MTIHASSLVVAVPAALAGAASMGLASAAQAIASKQIPRYKTLDPKLLGRISHRPLWIAGGIATVAGLGLQLVALAFAPLILVQPLLVTSLVFAAGFTALLRHSRVDRVVVAGSFICAAGLAAFLLVARPSGQQGWRPGIWHVVALAVVLFVVAALGLVAGTVGRESVAVLGLALTTGVLYGVTAGLMKVVAVQLRVSPWEPLRHWVLYVVCVIGPAGFLLSQNTFQRGRLLAPALAVITITDPLVGVAIGVWWLGEQVATSTSALAGEAIAAIAIVVGVTMLTNRAAHLPSGSDDDDTPAPRRKADRGKVAWLCGEC